MALHPHDLLKGYVEVSSLPMVYYKIDEAINRPNGSMADIGRIVSEDPGLTVRLLRMVNSAFYSFPSKIETITQALIVIGTKQLRDFVLATSIVNLFQGIPKDLVSMESFWHHSIACGLAAKTIAKYRRETNIEQFLIAGMVHDIGRLIMYKKIGDQSRSVLIRCKTSGIPLFLAEQEVIGFDHAQMGRILLQTWNLPSSLEEAVAFHHHPLGASRYPVETAVVHIADIMVNGFRWGTSGERTVPPLKAEAWERIGLPVSVQPSILNDLRGQVNDVTHSILNGEQRWTLFRMKARTSLN